MRIPFNKPPYIGKESEYVFDAVNKGHISGDGEYTKKCAKSKKSLAEQSEHFLLHHVLHATEMAALLSDVSKHSAISTIK